MKRRDDGPKKITFRDADRGKWTMVRDILHDPRARTTDGTLTFPKARFALTRPPKGARADTREDRKERERQFRAAWRALRRFDVLTVVRRELEPPHTAHCEIDRNAAALHGVWEGIAEWAFDKEAS